NCDDADIDNDGDVDGQDLGKCQPCMCANGEEPPALCGTSSPTGTYALHGRPVDVLSDGHVLVYIRARYFDPQHGRWLQRDPKGYVDGMNLYKAFGNNPLVRRDPMGTDDVIEEPNGDLTYTAGENFFNSGDWSWSWTFGKSFLPGYVIIDHPEWPFAFVMSRQAAKSHFDTVWGESDFRNHWEMLASLAKSVTDSGFKSETIPYVVDKRAESAGMIDSNHIGYADPKYDTMTNLRSAGLDRQIGDAANLTALSYTMTMGMLVFPAGPGAAVADAVSVGADIASGRFSGEDAARAVLFVTVGTIVYKLSFADDGLVATKSARPISSSRYSVAFEARLQKGAHFPGQSDAFHFQQANRQLHKFFQANPQMAGKFESMYPGIVKGVKPSAQGAFPRRAPTPDVTWHHAPDEGILYLMPRSHHTAPGAVQKTLHPGGRGGMEIWGSGRKWRP
ncbi:MAG: RHS repeat-associated core domain-containing protein, partial [Planctomycetota bacterium]